MKKDIYKITNTVNGKIYIGQSKNPRRRFKEHYLGNHDGGQSLIHNAMQKYGIDSFTLEILEHDIENYNEREIYWISFYNSNTRDIGYNVLKGGEDPPILSGTDSSLCKFSDDDIRNILIDPRDTDMTYGDICKKHNVSDIYVQRLNAGSARRIDGFSYPIRAHRNCRKTEDIVMSVINDLITTSDSIEEIARSHDMDSNTIYWINNGTHSLSPNNYDYPLRGDYNRISRIMIEDIYADLADNKLKMQDIERKYNISHKTASEINRGLRYRDDRFNYPIRKSSQRVYSTCRDYPGLDRE